MAYRNKQETIEIAERLGVDVSGMTWPEMQRAVSAALKSNDNDNTKKKSSNYKYKKIRFNKEMEPYLNKKILIAPEMYPDAKRYVHYHEELGDDLEIEEISMLGLEGGKIDWRGTNDMKTGTYKVKGKTGRKVVADSALPRQNAGIGWNLSREWFPVVEFMGQRGYLYRHPSKLNFRAMLDDLNVYEDYRSVLQRNGVLFYLTGLLCIDIGVAENIMKDIEKRAARGELEQWGL